MFTSYSSSLVTGARSHKLVTSDVSRILWLYYNDSVSISHRIYCLVLSIYRHPANTFLGMRWERGLLFVIISHEVEHNSHRSTCVSGVDICTGNGMYECWSLHFEERDQRGTAVEGIEDSSGGRPRRKTRNEDEKGGKVTEWLLTL